MYYILYIDRLFFLNFCMDFFALSLTGLSLKRTVTRLRMILSALLGSAGYIAVIFLPYVPYPVKTAVGFTGVSILMVWFMYPKSGLSFLARALAFLYGFTFLFGGVLLFLKKYTDFTGDGGWVQILLPSGILYLSVRYFLKKRRDRAKECEVTLFCGEKQLMFKALVDSGNMLTEPISKKPVSIVEAESLKKAGIAVREEKCKVIPYHSVGKSRGILMGYEFPGMRIRMEDGDRNIEKVIVAVSEDKLFSGGKYGMILHPKLLEG